MRRHNLPVFILEDVRKRSVKHARPPARKSSRVITECGSTTAGFNTHHANLFLADEVIEQSDGVASAAHAGYEYVRQPAFLLENLRARFSADDRLELSNHHRVRMRTKDRAEHVVCRTDVRYPVAHGFIDGVLQRFAA